MASSPHSDSGPSQAAARPAGQFRLVTIFAAMVLAAALYSCVHVMLDVPPTIDWEPWNRARLDEHLHARRTVVVYFHAHWDIGSSRIRRQVWEHRALYQELQQREVRFLEVNLTEENAPGEDWLDELSPGPGAMPLPLVLVYRRGEQPQLLRREEITAEAVHQAIR